MSPAPLPAAPQMAAPPMPAAIKVPSPMVDHASPQGILSALSRTAPFSALNASQLAAVAGVVTPIKASKGTRLVAEGATPQIFVIVVQGELAVMKDSKGVGVLRPLDSFGFKNLFADCMSPVSIAVNGSTACFTLQIERAAFAKVLSANPDIAMALLPTLAAAAPDAAEVALHSGTLVTPTTASSDHLMVPSDKMPASCVPRDPTQLKIKVFDSKSYQAAFFRKLNEEKGYGYQLEFVEEKLSKDTVHMAKGAHAVCVFVHDSVDAHVAQSLVDMGIEMVAYRCAGFDMCDVKACDKLGVSVARVPAYSPYAVAEHAATLMMCLNRKIVWASSRVHNGDFSLDGLVGFDMKGKTVGVVGTGKIGACLVSIMLGFGCRVLCHDVYKNPSLLANPAVQYVEMNDLLAQADIISIHAPLMPETKHMFNAKSFAQCKRGVMIVNTSRGPLIDTKALIEALKAGQVGACGLDVVEGENDYFYENKSDQVITNDEIAHLLAFQNRVIITAHQAFLTQEALSEIAATTLKNVAEWHGGKKLKQLANSINTVMPSVAPSPAMQMVSAAPEGKKQ